MLQLQFGTTHSSTDNGLEGMVVVAVWCHVADANSGELLVRKPKVWQEELSGISSDAQLQAARDEAGIEGSSTEHKTSTDG